MLQGTLLPRAGIAIQQGTPSTAENDRESTGPSFVGKSWRANGRPSDKPCQAGPNPSLKRSANGRPPGPRGALVYPAPRGPGVLPLSPA
jgi:hypothetical protein